MAKAVYLFNSSKAILRTSRGVVEMRCHVAAGIVPKQIAYGNFFLNSSTSEA
jgi:hypothetical protein